MAYARLRRLGTYPLNGRMLRPDNYVQDPANSQSYNRYSYCWNNPLKYTDPSGDIVWALPYLTINKRGIDFGVSGGVGIPGTFGVQGNVSYGTTNNFSASVGVTALSSISGNVGWGTNSGFFANAGIGVGLGMPGFSTNMTSAGVGWSQRGGLYAYGAGITVSQGGAVDFNPSIGYTYGFMSSRYALRGGQSTADITHDADGYLTAETTEIIKYLHGSSNGPWKYGPTGVDVSGISTANGLWGTAVGFTEISTLAGQGQYITSKGLIRSINYANLTKHSTPYANAGKVLKSWGRSSAVLGVAVDAYAYRNNQISGAHFGVNTCVTAWGLGVGAAGMAVPAFIGGALYFGIDAFYPGGFNGAMEMNSNLIEQNQQILGSGFNLYRDR